MSNTTTNKSASHWCKEVIEEVVPTFSSAPNLFMPDNTQNHLTEFAQSSSKILFSPRDTSGEIDGLSAASLPTLNLSINPQYVQYYQQYYQSMHNPTPSLGFQAHKQKDVEAGDMHQPKVDPRLLLSANTRTNVESSDNTGTSNRASKQKLSTINKTTSSGKSGGDKQPPTLKEFVRRCFAACASDVERDHVNKELSKLIRRVTAEGRLLIHRWDLEPPIFTGSEGSKNEVISVINVLEEESSQNRSNRKSRFSKISENNETFTVSNATSCVISSQLTSPELEPPHMRERRKKRFIDSNDNSIISDERRNKQMKKEINKQENKIICSRGGDLSDVETFQIIGTCSKLEKDYLRLTSAPLPNSVRPENVLRKAIHYIKNKWDNDEVDYVYMCSQLKSIRQDLTVQHIQNELTVHVYETHARVALECSDLNEYNQCQTQLKQLYGAGIVGNEMEFVAYRILYYNYLLRNKSYGQGSSDLAFVMSNLTCDAKRNHAVQHALQVRTALQLDNYNAFFSLYKKTPNMGNYILNMMIDSLRVKALQRILKAYKPEIDISFVLQELAFESDDLQKGEEFLAKLKCDIVTDESNNSKVINTRNVNIDYSSILNDKLLL